MWRDSPVWPFWQRGKMSTPCLSCPLTRRTFTDFGSRPGFQGQERLYGVEWELVSKRWWGKTVFFEQSLIDSSGTISPILGTSTQFRPLTTFVCLPRLRRTRNSSENTSGGESCSEFRHKWLLRTLWLSPLLTYGGLTPDRLPNRGRNPCPSLLSTVRHRQ